MKRNDPVVVEGAVYEDRDRRAKGRKVRVERIYRMGGEQDYARCVVVSSAPPYSRVSGRSPTILLTRLRSRDYQLVWSPEGNQPAQASV